MSVRKYGIPGNSGNGPFVGGGKPIGTPLTETSTAPPITTEQFDKTTLFIIAFVIWALS